jgi:hypothetical protein
MTTLTPDGKKSFKAMSMCLGLLNAEGFNSTDGAYGLALATYLACKNSLMMTDADYMRLCELIITWGKDFTIEAPPSQESGQDG